MANLPPPTSVQASKTRERVDSSLSNVAEPNKVTQPVVNQSSFEQPSESPKGYEVDPTIPLENQRFVTVFDLFHLSSCFVQLPEGKWALPIIS